jgi:SNF2 family DNA or RNA helicase
VKPPLYDHQVTGIETLVHEPYHLLADEQGAGKTRQVIEALQELYTRDLIDRAAIVTPAPVRGVWFDPELGQLQEYLTIPAVVTEFRAKLRSWEKDGEFPTDYPEEDRILRIYVTNYEFLRRANRLKDFMAVAGERTVLICDESSYVSGHKSKQTRAIYDFRQKCGRVWLLNGTPIGDNPGNLYSQAKIMDPGILGCRNWFQFRARYAVLGGFKGKQIIKWTNQEDLMRRLKPHVTRRLKADCMDLPEKLAPVALEVPLQPKTWSLYKQMRDDCIAFLEEHRSAGAQAGVRVMRLAQITSGFLGGVTSIEDEGDPTTEEVGREKLDFQLAWVAEQLELDPNFKLLLWCRFRPELARAAAELGALFQHAGAIWGSQKKDERAAALRLLNPKTAPKGSVLLAGTTQTGMMGLDLQATHTVAYSSHDYRRLVRKQSEDRAHRSGQTHPVSYFDCVATGPDGQRTIDHLILKSLRQKEDTANWTTSQWVSALKETR